MAETGKKIVFEGIDRTSSAAESAKKGLVGLHEANVKGLKDTNALLKENISLLERQKQLITSIASEGLSKAQGSSVGQLTNKLFATPERVNPEHLKSFSKILESQMHIGQAGPMSDKLIQKVQELIETQKLQHRETMAEDKKDDEEGKKLISNKGALTFLGHEREKITEKERIEKLNVESLRKNSGEEKVDTATQNKMMTVLMDAMHGNMIGAAGTAVEGAEEKLGKSMPWVAGALALGGILYEREKEKRAMQSGATTGEELRFTELESKLQTPTESAMNVAAEKRHRAELNAFQSGQFAAFATTGNVENASFMGEGLGISAAETAAMVSGSSRARGRNVSAKEMFGSQFANKVLGVDQGTIGSLEQQSRYGGGSNIKSVTEEVITSMGLEKDRSKANEYLQMLVNLGQLHLNTLGKIDQKGDIAIMKSFTSGSGTLFQNAETLMPIVQGLNTGLASPQTSFAKAERFASLSKLHPGASFPAMMREMQKGISSKGYLKETLDRIAKRGGGRDGMVMELVATGLVSNYEQAYELVDDYLKSHGTMFDNMAGANISGSDTSGQMKNVVDRFDKVSAAKIKNAFLTSPEKGMEVAQQEADLFAGRGKQGIDKEGTVLSKFAASSGDAANKMVDVAAKAKVVSNELHETGVQIKAANDYLRTFLSKNKNGAKSQ